jgi:hypothetical protein
MVASFLSPMETVGIEVGTVSGKKFQSDFMVPASMGPPGFGIHGRRDITFHEFYIKILATKNDPASSLMQNAALRHMALQHYRKG